MLEDMAEVQTQANLVSEAANKHPSFSFFHKKTALIDYLMIFIKEMGSCENNSGDIIRDDLNISRIVIYVIKLKSVIIKYIT